MPVLKDAADETSRTRRLGRAAAVVIPVLVGVLVAYVLARGRQGPQQAPDTEEPQPVSVVSVPSLDVTPTAIGYGIAQPGDVWQAVAEVDGRIAEKHPLLEQGSILPEDTVVLRIDSTDFELRVAELKAEMRARQAQLQALETQAGNTEKTLRIERRSLEVARVELARRQALVEERTIPPADVDQQERAVLQQERTVQSLENELATIPDERERLQAELERARARLAQARRDLKHTTIALPFDARIARVDVERAQFVSPGQVLAVADSIAVTEVPAQIAVDRFRRVLAEGIPIPALKNGAVQQYLQAQGLSAVVRLHTGAHHATWPARIDRLSDSLDPETRTVGVVLAVDQPYTNAQPPERPPLVKNMYVEAELRGRRRAHTLVIPRSALHGQQVYVVGHDNRLAIRDVKVDFAQDDFVVIKEGLRAGEQVLVGELIPAIEGTLLEPVIDTAVAERLAAQAQGPTIP